MPREPKVWYWGDGSENFYVVAHSVAEACRLLNAKYNYNTGSQSFKNYASEPKNKDSDEALAKGVGVYPAK